MAMPKTFIGTLGFTESLVLAPIIKVGLNRDDKIIILKPIDKGEEDRVSNTLKKLKSMLDAISGGTLTFETVGVEVDNFSKAVSRIRELIEKKAEENEVYVNISGGMRALVIETYTATLLAKTLKPNIHFTELELEGSKGNIKITPIIFPKHLTETKKKILKTLKEHKKPIGMIALSRDLKLSRSTLSRNLRDMASDGLLTLKKEGRRILAEITEEGEMLV